MGFLKFILYVAGVLFISYLCILYANHRSDVQRRKEEEAEELYKLRRAAKQHEEDRKRQEEQKKIEREKVENNLTERSSRFEYITRQYSKSARFKKDYFAEYKEGIEDPFLSCLIFTTKIYFDFLRSALTEFSPLPSDCLHNADVHSAALLYAVAKKASFSYNGEFDFVKNISSCALKKMFVYCGFHKNLDATNLREEYELMNEFLYFYSLDVGFDEVAPRHYWQKYSNRVYSIPNNEVLTKYCDYFCDVIISPEIAFSKTPDKSYECISGLSLSDDEVRCFASEIAPHVYDIVNEYHTQLILLFEEIFSEENKNYFDATDNDDLLFIFGLETHSFYLEDYYFPFDK